MASPTKKFTQKSRDSIFGDLVQHHITDNSNLLDALDFVESPQGLDIKLYPVQRVLLKLIFGVPMDKDEREVPVYDIFCENLLYTFKETEYIKYVYEQGRINISSWEEAQPEGYNEIVAIVGRRGGKSQLVSAIAAYKLYRLLNIHSPQEYYGLVHGSPIDFTFMAQDSEGSSRLFDKMKEDINKAPFFSPFLKSMNTEEMTFVSEADRHKRDITPSIKVASYPCTTGAVRGPSSFVLALDEFAFYRTQIGANSDEIYKAASPATMQFKAGGTRDGKRESMILIITSPNGKIGKYYSLYQSGMKMGNESDILSFRCSTAEMNPRSDVAFLKKEHRENPDVFRAEYGGDFLEAAESYVKLTTIESCIEIGRQNAESFEPRMMAQKFFWGLDLGMQHDGTALSICHWEPLQELGAKLVFDYIDRMMVGEGKYEQGFKELPLEDVLDWLKTKNDLLPCFRGATDQHGGSMLVQLLQTYGINGLDLVHLTSGINSQMYLVLKGLMQQKKVTFPDVKKFHDEIKLVEANYIGKYQIKVQAPAEKDAHDDMCDSTALASWVAQQWATGEGAREFADIMNGWNPANFVNGLPKNGLDLQTSSMSELRSYERQLAIMQKVNGGVQNPFKRR